MAGPRTSKADTVPPQARRRLRFRTVFGREGAIRVAETAVGGLLFLFVIQSLLGFSLFDGEFWARFQRTLWRGFVGTLYYSALTLPLSLGIGFLAGWARVSSHRFLSWPVTVYVDVLRGIPPIVLALFAFLFGPRLFPPEYRSQDVSLLFAALAIAIHSAAYQAEIFRAGLQSVPRGQLEAAQAIGLGRWQTMKAILLPQALRLSLPPLATEFATLVKDTSLLGALGASELFALVSDFNQLVARGLIGEFSWVFATWTVAALMYFLLTFAITRVFRFVETWVRVPGMEGVSA